MIKFEASIQIKMQLSKILFQLEQLAPPSLQESYDNAGLLTGNPDMEIKGVLVCLDSTEEIIDEAIRKGCNLIVAHHPIIFGGIRQLTGKNYVERVIIKAIRHDIALYAIHTNLDNVQNGVNRRIADRLGLKNTRILSPMMGRIKKLVSYVPVANAETVKEALFNAGAGQIGAYSECAFSTLGTGSFKGNELSNPVIGQRGERHHEQEERIELIFPDWKEIPVMHALRNSHPYEEIAYQIFSIDNPIQEAGAGLIGEWPQEMSTEACLDHIKSTMKAAVIRHTKLINSHIRTVAVCGGSGSFLLKDAIKSGADLFLSADFKYHQFFDAEDKIIIADIGHFETEQFTIDLLAEYIRGKFTTFAVHLTDINTNPITYR